MEGASSVISVASGTFGAALLVGLTVALMVLSGLEHLEVARSRRWLQFGAAHNARVRASETASPKLRPVGTRGTYRVVSQLMQASSWAIDKAGIRSSLSESIANAGIHTSAEALLLACATVSLSVYTMMLAANLSAYALFGAAAVPVGLAWYIRNATANKRKQIRQQVPFFFDSIASSVGAGRSLRQAISHAADNTPDPLGEYVRLMASELALGQHVHVALETFARSLSLPEMNPVIHGLSLQHSIGGDERKLLISATRLIRQESALRDSLYAKTAQVRTSVKFVAIAPVVLLGILAIAMPDYLSVFYETHQGRLLFLAAVTLDVLGVIAVQRVIRKVAA